MLIRPKEGDRDEITMVAPRDEDLEEIFHRVNNAFIARLELNFHEENLRLPYHLRANADVLQCQIGALCIEDTSARIDYALLDFLGFQLKPQSYATSIVGELRQDYVLLFAHDTLSDYVTEYEVSRPE